jgi:hypothetical protein
MMMKKREDGADRNRTGKGSEAHEFSKRAPRANWGQRHQIECMNEWKKGIPLPGVEPGLLRLQPSMLPLHHRGDDDE